VRGAADGEAVDGAVGEAAVGDALGEVLGEEDAATSSGVVF